MQAKAAASEAKQKAAALAKSQQVDKSNEGSEEPEVDVSDGVFEVLGYLPRTVFEER